MIFLSLSPLPFRFTYVVRFSRSGQGVVRAKTSQTRGQPWAEFLTLQYELLIQHFGL